ncbi:protein Mis18-beta [Platichthys flesus]|uniref:protein Mis18-beta n=1 Tax=Platichthys flesus TaxID=8260 RepID=UPI002DB6A155|nr:protein Mis18-beta [Platichthys flesus]
MEFDDSVLTRRVDGGKAGAEEARTRPHMTLHCTQCNTVMADSLSICGEITCMNLIVCLRATSDVVISNTKESGHKGEMANCIYSSLKCRGCRSSVGKVIHSAPSRWASIRSLFLLHRANITCYILDSRSMVKASTITLDLKPVKQNIDEVRKQFQVQLDRMLCLKSRLAERSITSVLEK